MRESRRAKRIAIEYEQRKRWEEKAKRLEKFRKEKEKKEDGNSK